MVEAGLYLQSGWGNASTLTAEAEAVVGCSCELGEKVVGDPPQAVAVAAAEL